MYFNLTLRVNRELIRDPEKLDVTLRGFEANLLQRDLLGDEVLEARRMEVVEIIRDSRVFAAARERFPKDRASAYMARDAARAGREALRSSAGPPVGEMAIRGAIFRLRRQTPLDASVEWSSSTREGKRSTSRPSHEMLMVTAAPENPWASLAETTDDARPAKRARR